MPAEGNGAMSSERDRATGSTSLVSPALSVVVVAIAALLVRLAALGHRVATATEGRLGYRILQFQSTGAWAYHPAGGSPLLVHVDHWLFALVGPDDVVARLFVAIVGGCLPLAALLVRDRLRDGAVVGVAAVLAASPALLYYSRFLSPVVPVAAFSLVAAGVGIRLVDRADRRYLVALGGAVALAIGADEMAILVLGAGVVAGVLVAGRPAIDRLVAIRAASGPLGRPLAGSIALFSTVVIVLFAPRGAGVGSTPLCAGVVCPLSGVLFESTVGAASAIAGYWFRAPVIAGSFVAGVESALATLIASAPAVALLAPVGAVSTYWSGVRGSSRTLVRFATLWAGMLLAGVGILTPGSDPAALVPAIVVLAIPAGVGLAAIVGWAVRALRRDAVVAGALVAMILGAVAVQTAAVAVDGVYRQPSADGNGLAPADAGDEGLGAVLDLADLATDGAVDRPGVLVYGSTATDSVTLAAATETESATGSLPQPLPWYFAAGNATVGTTNDTGRIAADRPPVVVARSARASGLVPHLGGYVAFPVTVPGTEERLVVFVRADRVPADRWTAALSPGSARS
jgi:uncharacterized protein (TIGR03663 family)